MATKQRLRLLVQRYTETNADGQLIPTELVNWGATILSEQTTVTEDYRKQTNNLPITFQETEVNDEDTPFEALFNNAVHGLQDQMVRIHSIKLMAVTVGHMHDAKIELLPKEEGFDGWDFLLDGPTYYKSVDKEWYPLGIGDEIEVSLDNFIFKRGCQVKCSVMKVIERHSTYHKEYHDQKQLNRLDKDFTCMSGHAVAYVKTEEFSIGTSKKGYPTKEVRVSFNGIKHWKHVRTDACPMPILGDLTQIGTEYRIWIKPAVTDKNPKGYRLTAEKTEDFDKRNAVFHKSESIVPVTGSVCLLSADRQDTLLWISSEGGKYHNNAFKIDVRKGTKNYSDPEVANAFGALVYDYLPLGFPATFALYPEEKTGKSKIKLRGLLPRLHGRTSTDQEARDAMNSLSVPAQPKKKKKDVVHEPHPTMVSRKWRLSECTWMTPYQLKDDEVLFTSPGYAGHGDKKTVPSALMEYAKGGLFSTEVKIPAEVWRDGNYIRIDAKSALANEYLRLQTAKGQTEKMKICCILLGKVLLTTSGGYPVSYTCCNEEEEDMFRSLMFQTTDLIIDTISGDRIIVRRPSDFPKLAAGLHIGSYLPARQVQKDDEGHWMMKTESGLTCHILSDLLNDGEVIDEEDNLQLLAIDYKKEQLLAIACPDRITYPTAKQTQITVHRQLSTQDWLCHTNNSLFAIMRTTSLENKLIAHLQRLYGDKIPVIVRPLPAANNNGAATCRFDGKVCGADYSRLLSRQSMPLQVAISEETPKVFYHDAVVTALPEELSAGPMQWVIPTGQQDSQGCFLCCRGVTPDSHQGTRHNTSVSSQGVMAVVAEVDSNNTMRQSLSLQVGTRIYRLNTEEQLHLSTRDFLLSSIFKKGQQWQVKLEGDSCELNSDAPRRATEYTLMAKCRRADDNDWVLRSDDGRIGIAKNLNNVKKGDKRFMVFSEYYNASTLLKEGKQNLTGLQVCLVLDSRDDSGKDFCCHQPSSNKHFVVEEDLWNWNAKRIPMKHTDNLRGAAFLSRIVSYKDEGGRANRRCLLPQCELIQGGKISEGVYQMKVAGHNDNGYLLEQNGVKALLPWEEAALFYIDRDDIDIVEGYLTKGSLVAIRLHEQSQGEELRAEWRTLHKDIFESWQEKVEYKEIHDAHIHHLYYDHAFLELDGAFIHLTAGQLGLWEGQMLDDLYQQGDIVEDCVILWDDKHGCYDFSIEHHNDAPENLPGERQLLAIARAAVANPPVEQQVYEGRLLRYEDLTKNYDCFVEFGPNRCWVAKVLGSELSWLPFAEGRPPYKEGDAVRIKVTTVDVDQDKGKRVIRGSIRMARPKPACGPIAGQVELHRFVEVKRNDYTRLYLVDEDGLPAILEQPDAIEEFNDIIAKIESKNYPWLPVNGVYDSLIVFYTISQKVVNNEMGKIQRYADERQTVKVRILEVRAGRLLVSLGAVIGSIEKFEATGQRSAPLKLFYQKNQEVKCIITETNIDEATFEASILQYKGFENMVGVKVNDRLPVTLLGHTQEQAKVTTDNHYIGFIPREEVSDNDFENWADRFTNERIWVVCTDIEPDSGILKFSRRRYLGEGLTDFEETEAIY